MKCLLVFDLVGNLVGKVLWGLIGFVIKRENDRM